jgi:hypothetical protein
MSHEHRTKIDRARLVALLGFPAGTEIRLGIPTGGYVEGDDTALLVYHDPAAAPASPPVPGGAREAAHAWMKLAGFSFWCTGPVAGPRDIDDAHDKDCNSLTAAFTAFAARGHR